MSDIIGSGIASYHSSGGAVEAPRRRWDFDGERRRLHQMHLALLAVGAVVVGVGGVNGRHGPRLVLFAGIVSGALEPATSAGFARSLRVVTHARLRSGRSVVIPLADALPGRLEDLPINDEDDGQWYVERCAGGENLRAENVYF